MHIFAECHLTGGAFRIHQNSILKGFGCIHAQCAGAGKGDITAVSVTPNGDLTERTGAGDFYFKVITHHIGEQTQVGGIHLVER